MLWRIERAVEQDDAVTAASASADLVECQSFRERFVGLAFRKPVGRVATGNTGSQAPALFHCDFG